MFVGDTGYIECLWFEGGGIKGNEMTTSSNLAKGDELEAVLFVVNGGLDDVHLVELLLARK